MVHDGATICKDFDRHDVTVVALTFGWQNYVNQADKNFWGRYTQCVSHMRHLYRRYFIDPPTCWHNNIFANFKIHLYDTSICKPSMQMIFKKVAFVKERDLLFRWFFTLACCTIQGVGRLWHSKSKWIVKSCICKRKRFAVSMLFYAGVLYHSVGRL